MILLIDNFDSFSYNVYQLLGRVEAEIRVARNNALTLAEIERLAPRAIVLSPGPGRPADAGICIPVVQQFGGHIPILGICLGHQAVCEAYGATVSYAKTLMHGKTSQARMHPSHLFRGMGERVQVGRYHSLAAVRGTLPACLRVTAETDDGEVMAVEHTAAPVYGVQFHPESILTPQGEQMIRNFLEVRS